MDQTEEIQKIIENANQGNWIPVAIVTGIFSIIIFLLLHIWKKMVEDQSKKNDKTDEILETLVKMTERMDIRIEYHEKDIEKLKK